MADGEQHHNAKLTYDQWTYVRSMRGVATLRSLASELGVGITTIHRAQHDHAWNRAYAETPIAPRRTADAWTQISGSARDGIVHLEDVQALCGKAARGRIGHYCARGRLRWLSRGRYEVVTDLKTCAYCGNVYSASSDTECGDYCTPRCKGLHEAREASGAHEPTAAEIRDALGRVLARQDKLTALDLVTELGADTAALRKRAQSFLHAEARKRHSAIDQHSSGVYARRRQLSGDGLPLDAANSHSGMMARLNRRLVVRPGFYSSGCTSR
jgi:hypothetical protein